MKKLVLLACALLVLAASSYAQFTFTSIDFPGAKVTIVRGINNHGEIVGDYGDSPLHSHAMLIKDGQFLPLAPTTVLGTNYSEAFKINDRGDVVGYFLGDDGFFHGFLLRKGVLTILDFPGASDTYAYGINESGTVAGSWDLLDSNGNLLAGHGYIWNNGNFSDVGFPGSADTSVTGINARGDFVGVWDEGSTSPIAHGFVFSKGRFISFDVPFPGATWTQGNDINAVGHIVGSYGFASGPIHAFLAVGATFTTIEYPGGAQTTVWGINSAGQIVGTYRDYLGGPVHGYLAQPISRVSVEEAKLE
jgi:uncharacterized membrane protein